MRRGGIGGSLMGGRIGVLALVAAAVWLLALAPGAGAEIIYAHGRPPARS